MTRKACLAAVVCALLLGCSGGSTPSEPTGTSFVAVADDFTGYHSWQSFDVSSEANTQGIHDGTVTEYVNALPPSGSSEFPLATLIVKEAIGGEMGHALFAMARRGGSFNSSGARGWEWFELENVGDASDRVTIVWRGFGPPLGEMYGGDPNSSCNTCHTKCADSVCSEPLNLANF